MITSKLLEGKKNVSEANFGVAEFDNGSKIEYIERHHAISRATYYRYLNLLIDNKLIELYHEKLLTGAISPTIEMTDAAMSLHIRSVDGSEGVDFGYKIRLRRSSLRSPIFS